MENDPLNELEQLYRTRYVSHSDLADFVNSHHLVAPTRREYTARQFKLLITGHFRALRNYRQTCISLNRFHFD